ncbi:hypothetical protein AB1M95_04550 [Sulfitobacter sp. LCG007]
MIRPSAFLATIFVAAPAFAHEGSHMHLHPHADSPAWWLVGAGLIGAAFGAFLMGRRK